MVRLHHGGHQGGQATAAAHGTAQHGKKARQQQHSLNSWNCKATVPQDDRTCTDTGKVPFFAWLTAHTNTFT
jgi:hypothetical protein